MSDPRGKKIHTTAQVPDCELKVHRRAIGSGAHASSHGDEPKSELKEQALARDEVGKAKVVWDGKRDQQHRNQGKQEGEQ